MDVVIVGAGKAGSLHYRAYCSLSRWGRLDRTRIQFIDRAEGAGPELAALLTRDGVPERIVAGREMLTETVPERTIVDLCLPSRSLAPALLDWWRAGYRKFLIEKPFLVAPELASEVRQALASSQAVLVRNYIHSGVHASVRELVELYDLAPVLCVTNFSKDRRADTLRGRGASHFGSPTVFEVEMPHQLYIGTDLLGDVRSLDHVEDLDAMRGQGEQLRLGEGVLVGRADSGASFIHYSNLRHTTVVRSLDLFCRGQLSIHASYAPVCETLTDIKAGAILSRGDTVLAKKLFTEDDNMLGMISDAYATLSNDTGGRVDTEAVFLSDAVIQTAIANSSAEWSAPPASRGDVLQQWVVDSFRMGLQAGIGRSFLRYLEQRQRERLFAVLPALDPSLGLALSGPARGGVMREALI